MIKFLDLQKINEEYSKELREAFDRVFKSGWFISGTEVTNFETAFAAYCGSKYCIGVANGLDALILSLKALGIGKGDEVIVPSNTYIASWLAITYVGAMPIAVEPRIDTYNINPLLIEEKITPATKAIMPVNLYGQAAELDKIVCIAKKYSLFVVEDNAQAQGANCNGILTGNWGHINATSFYPGKNLGALGDAGAVTTNNEELADLVRTTGNYGSQKKYFNKIKGVNSRLDELQAAFLSVKLKRIEAETIKRQFVASLYNKLLKDVGDIILPVLAEGCTSVYHLYIIRTKKRDALQQHLTNAGISTVIHYPIPPHLQEAYSELNQSKGSYPIAEEIAETCISLPISPIITEAEISTIVNCIKSFF